MKTITRSQAEVFDYIKNYIIDNHFPPTVREIGTHVSISGKAAYDHIKALQKKGFITSGNNRSRSIEICSGYSVGLPREICHANRGGHVLKLRILSRAKVSENC